MDVIIFGFGEMGKKLIDECLDYESNINIAAIADNNIAERYYRGISVIDPTQIIDYVYDEIWICTVYHKEIKKQLEELGINSNVMHFMEPVIPILEYRIKKSGILETENHEEEKHFLHNRHLRMYCYPFYEEYLNKDTEIFYDDRVNLYYGIYNNHKMYLARRFNSEQKARAYFNAVTMEQDSRSPHCYWNYKKLYEQTGIAVDVGAAEGIYGLQIIEQIEHLYMAEIDSEWVEALKCTHEPYKDKITILQKLIGNVDEKDKIKLDTVLGKNKITSIKLDIEGMEMEALLGAENIISNNKVLLAVCTYHHKEDNEVIGRWLREKGYYTENSNGVIICQGDWELEKDETGFRKALLFAEVI